MPATRVHSAPALRLLRGRQRLRLAHGPAWRQRALHCPRTSYEGFPLYPPAASSGLYATPKVANLTSIISSEEEEEYYEIRYVTPLCAMWENLHFVCISCVSGRLILVCPL